MNQSKWNRGVPLAAAAFAVAAVAAACGGGEEGGGPTEPGATRPPSVSGKVSVDGSSTVFPITEAVAEEFRNVAGDVQVTVGISGTGGGFEKFCNGETDISDASRPIKQEEIDACAANGIEYIELPIAYDGLAVVVNPENDWVDCLTVEELKKMWEPAAQGTITRWNQIRPDFPDEPLALFGAGTDSGTFDYFTEAIVGESGASRGDYTATEDDNVTVQGVAGTKNALGYFGLAYFEENADRLKLVAIDGGDGCVLPSAETVNNGTYTPLSRPLFIYVRADRADDPAVQAFVDYYLSDDAVKALVPEVGYIPLPDSVIEGARARWQARVTGSVFPDAPEGATLEELFAP
ncbi:MAG TPA: PstS family phosphate ABC transporter substrate-binding protein [Dehalococcoidia bacterium]|nr:PstS family phosphate ABC transporter substrate-binding protein [Dehalococcoidia bacterium]